MSTKAFPRIVIDGDQPSGEIGAAQVRLAEDEPDRATVHANGVVVDVIADDDGRVFVEFYGYGHEVVVTSSFLNERKPSLTLVTRD